VCSLETTNCGAKLKLSILHKGMIIVFVPLVVQIICIASLYSLQSELERELEREHHSRMIIETADKAIKDLYFGIGSARNSGNFNISEANHAFNSLVSQTKETLRNLSELVKDNPEEAAILKTIERELFTVTDNVVAARKLLREGSMDDAATKFGATIQDAKEVFKRTSKQLVLLVDRERAIEQNSPLILKAVRQQLQFALATALVANLILAALFALLFNRSIASRISIVSDNILRLAAGRELHKQLEGGDELSAMDDAFRSMATALSEAREQEQAMVSNAREVICSLTSDLKFLSVNPAIELLLGFSSEELIGARFVSILNPASIDASLEYLNGLQKQEAGKVLENEVVCKDGSVRVFVWSVKWSRDRNTYFCVAHDVTEPRNLERMKQDFIAMVSHDLRSPLCSIQAYTELLETGVYGDLTENGRGSLDNVNVDIARLIDLVSDLIDIEQLESGQLPLNVTAVSVKKLFDASTQSVTALATGKKISFECNDQDLSVLVDEGRMVQVLVNLLSNAIKFSADGSAIKLNAEPTVENITLSVIDSGRGIPRDRLSQVFERFKQVQASDSANRKGSGLGLSICKAIVEQHGGKIGVRSELGSGSTFWIELPKA
jgi:PAS domain S-box-containing protein